MSPHSNHQREETGWILTWIEFVLLLGWHYNHWTIGNLDMQYKMLKIMNAACGSTHGTID